MQEGGDPPTHGRNADTWGDEMTAIPGLVRFTADPRAVFILLVSREATRGRIGAKFFQIIGGKCPHIN